MHSDVLSGDRPGFGQQGKGFWSSLDGPWFDAPGTVTHALLRDQDKQRVALAVVRGAAAVMIPGDPQLQGVFKTEFARAARAEHRRLGHHQPDEVVGEQVNPDFLLRHRRCFAAQPLHAQRGLDVTKVELNLPTLAV